MNILYAVGKRTSATQGAVRHIDHNGTPLCWTKHNSGKSFGGGLVRDTGEPTCKRCIKIWQETTK